jgi:hypothetical protein
MATAKRKAAKRESKAGPAVFVRVTAAEQRQIQAAAKRDGWPLGLWARLALKHFVKEPMKVKGPGPLKVRP